MLAHLLNAILAHCLDPPSTAAHLAESVSQRRAFRMLSSVQLTQVWGVLSELTALRGNEAASPAHTVSVGMSEYTYTVRTQAVSLFDAGTSRF